MLGDLPHGRHARPLLLFLVLLLPLPAGAEPTFEALAARAHALKSLRSFLESYVGECTDPFERAPCEANARRIRSELTGKLLRVRLPDAHGRLFRVVRELRGGRLQMVLTPFFGAGGYGLAARRPKGTDARGNPRVALLPFRIRLPEGMGRRDLERMLSTGNARIELLFRPRKVFTLRRRRGGPVRGVQAKLVGVRIRDRRSDRLAVEHLF
ncbi:MAG: hypothetical protein D6729_17720 [Deltaproteobacteria bacterium]|nr:MAG: hypothetical protein D6729_17720 [Deltaproteobacteria bacterium]